MTARRKSPLRRRLEDSRDALDAMRGVVGHHVREFTIWHLKHMARWPHDTPILDWQDLRNGGPGIRHERPE